VATVQNVFSSNEHEQHKKRLFILGWSGLYRSPAGAKDFSRSFCVQTGSGAHPTSCTMCTGGPFPGTKRGQGVALTIYPHPVPRSRMSGATPPHPPSATMACSGTAKKMKRYVTRMTTFNLNVFRSSWERSCGQTKSQKLHTFFNCMIPCKHAYQFKSKKLSVQLNVRHAQLLSLQERNA
jgi:hypothetical protein